MAETKTEQNDGDWRRGLTMLQRYLYMLEHGIGTDLVFVVGPKNRDREIKEIKAHRMPLIQASPVFEAMLLQCHMSEAITGRVRVTDFSPRAFHLLLRLVYGASVDELTVRDTHIVAMAAHKYQMTSVYETCMNRLCMEVSKYTIWNSLQLARLVEHEELYERCITMLRNNTQKILAIEDFLELPEDCVALLLKQDKLSLENDMVLVNAVVAWARCEAQRRGLAGDDAGVRDVLRPRLLKLLPLQKLSPQQFALGPGLSAWLTEWEKSEKIRTIFTLSLLRNIRQSMDS